MKNKTKFKNILILFLLQLILPAAAGASNIDSLSADHYGVLVSLDEAVLRTLESDARVKEASARLMKEKALYKSRRAEFFPKIGTELFQGVATGDRKTVTLFDTSITQPLFQGGKLRAEKDRQKTRVQKEELKLSEVRLDLKLSVEMLYAEALGEKELTRIAQMAVKSLSRESVYMKALYEKEFITYAELLSVQTLVQKAAQELVEHKERYDYLTGFLKDMLGVDGSESLEFQSLKEIPSIEPAVAFYFKSAHAKDPFYQMKDLEVREKSLEKKSLQAERFPRIDFVAKSDIRKDSYLDENRFLAGLAVKWDIWDFGRLGNQIDAKSHEIEETESGFKVKTQEKERRIREYFHKARALHERIQYSEVLIKEREENYKNIKVSEMAGRASAKQVLESYLVLQDGYCQQIQAVTHYRMLVSQLHRESAVETIVKMPEEENVLLT